jgi:hypothetical protein
VKIDVEGFEEEVLKGGVATFSEPSCRHVLVEVHFSRIDERGLGDAAARIVKMLKHWGYIIRWVDASHLHASRLPDNLLPGAFQSPHFNPLRA